MNKEFMVQGDKTMRFLIIEDDRDVRNLLRLTLRTRWPDMEWLTASTGEEGAALAKIMSPDFVLLDMMLPDMSGEDVLLRVREFSNVPVIVVSARDSEAAAIRVLEAGADDYVLKPFRHAELLSRITAVMRRAGSTEQEQAILYAGDLVIDMVNSRVLKDGRDLDLTLTELRLLSGLAVNDGEAMSFDNLGRRAFKVNRVTELEIRVLRVHIRRLRGKLGDSAYQPTYIENVQGVGYRFLPNISSNGQSSSEQKAAG